MQPNGPQVATGGSPTTGPGGTAGVDRGGQGGAATPILIEAEGGQLGANVRVVESVDGAPGYVTPRQDEKEQPRDLEGPSTIRLQVDFPEAGEYQLFARLRIGPAGDEDDSFFANVGSKAAPDWANINQISGFSVAGEPGHQPGVIVRAGGGDSTSGAWKWSLFDEHRFSVAAGELSRTLYFATREDGLDIDKFAFAIVGSDHTTGFTTDQLDRGLPGVVLPAASLPPPYQPPSEQPPLVPVGAPKYLGMVCCGSQRPFLENYFGQITPENAGKWGSVEATRNEYQWERLDEAMSIAENNGFPFRFHVLLWGSQQPNWISELPPEQQREEIREWFEAVAERYGSRVAYVEVANEFVHQPPTADHEGNYTEALGGAGSSGFDWVLSAFRLAREVFPSSARLMLNEYGVVSDDELTDTYVQLAKRLQAEDLIDAIGVQGHAFSTRGSVGDMVARIDRLGQTGLPVLITEMDVDGPEVPQLATFQRIFPPFWENEHVGGITLWGYRDGMWRESNGATLVYPNGAEKPAFRWLKGYLRGNGPRIAGPTSVRVSSSAPAGTPVATLAARTASGAPFPEGTDVAWSISGGDGALELSRDGLVVLTRSLAAGTLSVRCYADVEATVSNIHTLRLTIE